MSTLVWLFLIMASTIAGYIGFKIGYQVGKSSKKV